MCRQQWVLFAKCGDIHSFAYRCNKNSGHNSFESCTVNRHLNDDSTLITLAGGCKSRNIEVAQCDFRRKHEIWDNGDNAWIICSNDWYDAVNIRRGVVRSVPQSDKAGQ